MERIFKITDDFCLFNGNILDYESPIDMNYISKINPYGGKNKHKYNQICNEYIIGQKLSKYQEFLTAEKCETIKRNTGEDGYLYDNIRDEYIFENCNNLVKDIDTIEVYVYQKSGNDLQHYFDNPDKLYNLLTKNNTINIYDGINILIIYFINILIILYNEKIIHKDIKPGNIIVGVDLINFPENIKIIDLGFSFQYNNFSEFVLNQSIELYDDVKLEDLKSKYMTDNLLELSHRFLLDLYNDDNLDKYIEIFNVITNAATPDYSAPEFNIRLSRGIIRPTIASMICPDIRSGATAVALTLRKDIVKYIISNQNNINYTELLQLYLRETGDYFDLIKNETIEKSVIKDIIEYNKKYDIKYNLFEIIYIMSNGITGSSPIIYKYDLFAFGLILREIVNTYKLLYDPRKYRIKKSKTIKKGAIKKRIKNKFKRSKSKAVKSKADKSKQKINKSKSKSKSKGKPSKTRYSISKKKKGGNPLKLYDYTDIKYNKEFKIIEYIINNMVNPDCIYRWSLDDLIKFYNGEDIINEKYIDIMGNQYLLCSTDINADTIITQFKHIDPNLKSEKSDIWDDIKQTLTDRGMGARKIHMTIQKMKKKGITSLDDL